MTLTFTILKNNTAVYAETQAPITPSGGLLTATVGARTPSQGTFTGIDWSNGPFLLNVKMKIGSGAVMDMGTSQILPVPIALYAQNGNSGWNLVNDLVTTDKEVKMKKPMDIEVETNDPSAYIVSVHLV